jgi:hypothetical protein
VIGIIFDGTILTSAEEAAQVPEADAEKMDRISWAWLKWRKAELPCTCLSCDYHRAMRVLNPGDPTVLKTVRSYPVNQRNAEQRRSA